MSKLQEVQISFEEVITVLKNQKSELEYAMILKDIKINKLEELVVQLEEKLKSYESEDVETVEVVEAELVD